MKLQQAKTTTDGDHTNNSYNKKVLKKDQFESELGLSTGRFENDGDQIKEQFSKSANHAKVLRIINAEKLVPAPQIDDHVEIPQAASMSTVGDNNMQVHPNQEQEMRETSYFKQ